jgi:hypothetical protein
MPKYGNIVDCPVSDYRQTCRIQKMRTYPVLVDAFKSFFKGQRPDTAFLHR